MITVNCSPSTSFLNSIFGCSLNARIIPEPSPRYGNILAAKEAIMGFRIAEFPYLIFSTVRPLGRQPRLMISMRLSKINNLIEALWNFNFREILIKSSAKIFLELFFI